MSSEKTFIVVTTIQRPTACMQTLARCATTHGLHWLVVGDRKGPQEFSLAPAELVSIDAQRRLPFALARRVPEGHYARKNLGYLLAIARGAERLYETDDDNAPIDGWQVREREVEARQVRANNGTRWANIYAAFTAERIWPRGLPLNHSRQPFADEFAISAAPVRTVAPIQQGLANGSPDVDAVWRLVLDHEIEFAPAPNLLLPRGVWCPFNSQNTWWWREVFPLLYLPSHCTMRMTDIWRGLVAQRCLWELGAQLEFHQADVRQERNEHDLMNDFDSETAGYLRNDEIRHVLESRVLKPGPAELRHNLHRCYESLVWAGVLPAAELVLVEAWLEDCTQLGLSRAA